MIRVIRAALGVCLAILVGLYGCGGEVKLSCDEERLYQRAVAGERVEVPEDLDALESVREMPLPEASPRPPRPPGSPCLDLPPNAQADD